MYAIEAKCMPLNCAIYTSLYQRCTMHAYIHQIMLLLGMSNAEERMHFPKTSKSGRKRIMMALTLQTFEPSILKIEYIYMYICQNCNVYIWKFPVITNYNPPFYLELFPRFHPKAHVGRVGTLQALHLKRLLPTSASSSRMWPKWMLTWPPQNVERKKCFSATKVGKVATAKFATIDLSANMHRKFSKIHLKLETIQSHLQLTSSH